MRPSIIQSQSIWDAPTIDVFAALPKINASVSTNGVQRLLQFIIRSPTLSAAILSEGTFNSFPDFVDGMECSAQYQWFSWHQCWRVVLVEWFRALQVNLCSGTVQMFLCVVLALELMPMRTHKTERTANSLFGAYAPFLWAMLAQNAPYICFTSAK